MNVPKLLINNYFVQFQKKMKQAFISNSIKEDFLIRGVIKCYNGSPMRAMERKKSKRNPLYSCSDMDKRYQGKV